MYKLQVRYRGRERKIAWCMSITIRAWVGHFTYLFTTVSKSRVDLQTGRRWCGLRTYLAVSARAVSSKRPPAPSHAFREHARSDCESSWSPVVGGTRAPADRLRIGRHERPTPSNHDQMWCSAGQSDASRRAGRTVPLIRTRTSPLYFDQSAMTTIMSVQNATHAK